MATKDWKMDLDAFGDPNWGRHVNGRYEELRIAPADDGWGLVLFNARGEYDDVGVKRKVLKKGLSRDDIIKFAEEYVRSH